ncbi:MAG TPA: TIGR03668 family PPOX class F420-dependent oxidoreductase [Ktedonobacterales bacterium]|nr:TIGR03668 family PPOX class F420-dependent oxidoreductase [Ktedonobacterales bacterium]
MSSSVLSTSDLRMLRSQRVAHLATADAAGHPHVVPVVFATDGARVYIALDEKRKRVPESALRRVRNLRERPEAALLLDHYDDDWSRLAWLLVYAVAQLLEPGAAGHADAVDLLRARYPQYVTMRIEGHTVIALTPTRVVRWSSSASGDQLGALTGAEPATSDFLTLAAARQTVRTFDGRPVPRDLVAAVLDAARWAPSPHGRQPWRFAILTRDVAKERLADAMATEWQRNLEMDQQPGEIVSLRLSKSRARLLNAPVLIIPCLYTAELDVYPDTERMRAEETMAVQSLGAAVQNLLLAARSLGLDAGWMCAPLFCPEVVRQTLDLIPGVVPHALITLGYKGKDPQRRPHRPAEELTLLWD